MRAAVDEGPGEPQEDEHDRARHLSRDSQVRPHLESFASSPLLSRRDEITIMTERKLDLERRIEALYSERDGLSTTLDESADRIVMLEKESREQDSMVEFR